MNKNKYAKHNPLWKTTAVLGVVVLFATQLSSCSGLYPHRRAGDRGQIEGARALMEDIGRLFFVVPGLAVFAVDFLQGAIYLPVPLTGEGPRVRLGPTRLRGPEDLRKIDVDAHRLDAEIIEGIVETETGKRVRLDADDLLIIAYKEQVDIRLTLLRLSREYGIPDLAPAGGEKTLSDFDQTEDHMAGR